MKNLLLILTLAILLPVANPTPPLANAQSNLEVQGLSIDPFLIELDMAPGQSLQRSIGLTNTTSSPLTFSASINDFTVANDNGQPLFLDSDEESDPNFSLSKWITVTQQPSFTIQPGEQTQITITVTVPIDAEPGTHYGGILFGQSSGELQTSGAAVQHKAGTIILVKLGKSEEKVRISEFITQRQIYSHGPVEFLTSLHNFGNVHSKPKGDITIRNIWGVQVTEVPVNPDALIVLPDSGRDFESTWNNKLGFGRYTAEAVLYYGNPKLELRIQTSFWMIPTKELVLGVLIALILGIIGYIGLKRYNSYIINKSRNED